MKQNKKVEQTTLKYFNLVLTVLMLVVLSLNIEQILHNRRIFKPDNFKIFKIANDTSNDGVFAQAVGDIQTNLLSDCRQCQQLSLRALNRLNGLGVILSLFLSAYSFLFAFKAEIFTKRFFLLVPGCIVVCLITVSYFILALLIKIPKVCVDSRVLNLGCDVDFEYNMNSKVIPLSVLMLVAIPQILVRAVLRVIMRCKHYRVHLKPSTPRILSNFNMNSNAWKQPTQPEEAREVLLDSQSEQRVVFGDRELPVDCELNENGSIPMSSLKETTINQTQNNYYFENMTQNFMILPPETMMNQIIEDSKTQSKPTLISTNHFGNRLYYLRSSLSTISEERTLSSTLNEQIELPRSSQMNFIEGLLNEIQTNSTLLNEILCVFKPSSKEGTFTRNVPIRFSSPQKSTKKDESHMTPNMTSSPAEFPNSTNSPSVQSIYSPNKDRTIAVLDASNTSNGSPDYFQRSSNQKTLVAKKIRFIKRLKNCIETKRGNRLNYLQQIPYLGNEWYKKSAADNSTLFESRAAVKSQEIVQPQPMQVVKSQSNIELDTSVEPVYF